MCVFCSIFIGSDDIRNQLPQEAKRFDMIDKTWLKIMADTAKNTNVLEACSTDGRYEAGFCSSLCHPIQVDTYMLGTSLTWC